MKTRQLYSFFSRARRYRYRTIFFIAIFWTVIDLIAFLFSDILHLKGNYRSLYLRELFVFIMSLVMGYLFVFTLKRIFRNFPPWINFISKSLILLLAAFFMNFLVHFLENKFIVGQSTTIAIRTFMDQAVSIEWLLQKTFYWIALFVVTQLYIELNEKYSPGVFMDIVLGKYTTPKVENRIVMFLDLKDSTPIAEKMGHQQYFLFIREFIHDISMAIIEHNGRIYQYVGDEVVVSWINTKRNARNALRSIHESRKNIRKKTKFYHDQFNQIPEFRVGLHIGDVTVGEIGVIKKDLAMSGDTMNTTARIRSACNELNHQYIVSAEFIRLYDLKEYQVESLGNVDLKGKLTDVELYAVKV